MGTGIGFIDVFFGPNRASGESTGVCEGLVGCMGLTAILIIEDSINIMGNETEM